MTLSELETIVQTITNRIWKEISDKNVKPEILKSVDEITQKIVSGEIKVPYNEETYNEYK